MARPKSKTKKILFAVEIIVLLLFIGGLYVYGLSSGRLGRRHDCADGAGRGTQFFRKSYTGCENVPGRLGHLYSGGGGHPGAGANSGADA